MTDNEYIAAVKRNSHRLFVIAFSYLKNQADAEDILQNTFYKLWNENKNFDTTEDIDKWLTRVCINDCKNNLKLFFRKHLSIDEAYNISSFDKHFNIDLFNAISSLNTKERICVILFYYDDMSIKDISFLMNINESTIKSILHRSREKLRKCLGDEWIYE